MHDGTEAGRNLGHSFAAASFGADDMLGMECDEEDQELVQIPFHISVYKDGKLSSGGVNSISVGSSPGGHGNGMKRRPSSTSTSTTRRTTYPYTARNSGGTVAGLKLKPTSADSSTASMSSPTEKTAGTGPSSVVKPPRGRRRPLKQNNTNEKAGVESRSSGSGSTPAQLTSRRRSSMGQGRKPGGGSGQGATPDKPKLRRKSPRKATAASKGNGNGSGHKESRSYHLER